MKRNAVLRLHVIVFLIMIAVTINAQSITTIPVETKNNAMVLQTGKDNRLWNVYFGEKLKDANDYASVANQYHFSDAMQVYITALTHLQVHGTLMNLLCR